MTPLIWAIGATIVVSLMSLVGILSLLITEKMLHRIVILMVGFSAGALMGGAFLHLIPEAVATSPVEQVSLWIILGFCLFFLIERVLHWHHCHKKGGDCAVHTFTYMNLLGDGVHNFIDGLIISAGYLSSIPTGIATTIAVIAHEIPQEIGEFGVLVYGGFSKIKALFFNFLSALTAVAGALLGYILFAYTEHFTAILVPFAAGGFIYIFASDLIPELHKEPKVGRSILSFAFFLIGIGLMITLKLWLGE